MNARKERLEAEIAERDARLEALEDGYANALLTIDKMMGSRGIEPEVQRLGSHVHNLTIQRENAREDARHARSDCERLQAELAALKAQQPSAGGAYSSDPLACSGCAAGCFRCRSSAGVVVGALVSALEGIVHDERVPNEVSQDYAALLIEARRLNPCRAQAVLDGWFDGLPPSGVLCEARIPHHTANGLKMLWCEVEALHHAIVKGSVYSWVKDPGSDGGFYAPMMLSFRRIAAAPSAKKEG